MKSSNIGGQAVLEGVMMKNKDTYAVAVRKPDGEIEVKKDIYRSITGNWKKLTQIPFIRGVFNFIDSMILGMSTLTWSASFFEDEEEAEKEKDKDKTSSPLLLPASMLLVDLPLRSPFCLTFSNSSAVIPIPLSLIVKVLFALSGVI